MPGALQGLGLIERRLNADLVVQLGQHSNTRTNRAWRLTSLTLKLAGDTGIDALRLRNPADLPVALAAFQGGGIRHIALQGAGFADHHLAQLPATLTSLTLDMCSGLSAQGLSHLARLSRLHTLDLGRSPVGADGLAVIDHLPRLKTLKAAATRLAASVGEHIRAHPSLEEVDMSDNALNDATFAALAENPRLASLKLMSAGVSSLAARALAEGCPALRRLDLTENQFDDHAAVALLRKPSLSELDLSVNGISEAPLAALADNTTLRSLALRNVGFNPAMAHAVATNASLVSLDIAVNNAEPEVADILTAHPALRVLHAADNRFDDTSLRALADMELESLQISDNDITEEGVDYLLRNNRTLSDLDISQAACDGSGCLADGIEAHPRLQRLLIDNTALGNEDFIALGKHPQLRELGLSNSDVDDAALAALARSGSVGTLDISYNQAVTAEGLSAYRDNAALRTLDVSALRLGTAEALALAAMPGLKHLVANRARMDDNTALALASLPSLETLDLSEVRLRPETRAALSAPRTPNTGPRVRLGAF